MSCLMQPSVREIALSSMSGLFSVANHLPSWVVLVIIEFSHAFAAATSGWMSNSASPILSSVENVSLSYTCCA